MATSKKILKQFNVTPSMAKRLADLYAGNVPHYGTSMAALEARGMVTRGGALGDAQLTPKGRETIEGLRAAGW